MEGQPDSVKVISRAITGISIVDYRWNSEGGIVHLSARGKKKLFIILKLKLHIP